MTRKEILEKIIMQEGNCHGVYCTAGGEQIDACPLKLKDHETCMLASKQALTKANAIYAEEFQQKTTKGDAMTYEFTELGREKIKPATECYCFKCGQFVVADIYNQCKKCNDADALIRVSDMLKLGWIKEKPKPLVIEFTGYVNALGEVNNVLPENMRRKSFKFKAVQVIK